MKPCIRVPAAGRLLRPADATSPSAGATAHGCLAPPSPGHGPGLIVIQEWWGPEDHIADVTEWLAREGFVALAPDPYGARVAHDADEAARMMCGTCPWNAASAALRGGRLSARPPRGHLRDRRVGRLPHGRRLCPPPGRGGPAGRRRGPLLRRHPGLPARLLGAEGRDSGTLRGNRRQRAAGLSGTAAGGHSESPESRRTSASTPPGTPFFNDRRPQTYHAESAWRSTVDFLHRRLG